MSKYTHQVEFTRLRTAIRQILLTEGTAIAPGTQTPEAIDDAIGDFVDQHDPHIERERTTLLAEVTDADLARRLSDHDGAIMAAYGDAGYFVGLAMGLELAALTFCQLATVPTITTRRVRKSGRR